MASAATSRGDLYGGRRVAVVGVSIGLHALLVLAVVLAGRRAALREDAPPSVEMMFDPAARVPAPVPEAASIAPAELSQAATPEAATLPPVSPVAAVPPDMPAPAQVESAAATAPELAEPPPVQAMTAPPQQVVALASPPRAAPQRAPVRPQAAERPHSRPPTPPASLLPTTPPASLLATTPPASLLATTSAVPLAAPTSPQAVVAISNRWRGALAAWIRARKRYPEEARRLGREGGAVVRFIVGNDGQVLDAQLAQGSGSDALDQAALGMFRSARVPPFPPEMTQPRVTVVVPVRFRLEE